MYWRLLVFHELWGNEAQNKIEEMFIELSDMFDDLSDFINKEIRESGNLYMMTYISKYIIILK